MVEVTMARRILKVPYKVRVYGVTEKTFYELLQPGMQAELIDGVMIVRSQVLPSYARLGGFFRSLMGGYVRQMQLGELFGPHALLSLPSHAKVAPDFYFLDRLHLPSRPGDLRLDELPNLVVEILSPLNRDSDLDNKCCAYEHAGIREIWLVDPDWKQVILKRKRGQRYTTTVVCSGKITSTVLKGFWAESNWLWANPRPKVAHCLREILY